MRLRRPAVAELRSAGDPPFEDLYPDYAAYLRVLAGEDVEAGLAHFRAEGGDGRPGRRGTLPAEVYVNLLLHAGRAAEAALTRPGGCWSTADERQLACPGPLELTRRQGDYAAFAEVARARGDAVHYLAGLMAGRANR